MMFEQLAVLRTPGKTIQPGYFNSVERQELCLAVSIGAS
jgi:hypothetical protein